jgi:preprotein translocase subunit Sec61beta
MPPEGRQRAFSSAAGLIQYYDMEESRALKIDPYIVIALGIGAAVFVEFLNWKFS